MVSSSLEGFEEVPVAPPTKGKKVAAPSLVSMLMVSSSDSDNEPDVLIDTPKAATDASTKPAPSQEAADQLKRHRDIMGLLESTFESVRMAKKENDGQRVLELVTELRKMASEARHALAGIDLRLQTLDIVPMMPDDAHDDDTERVTRCSFFPPLNRLGVGRATLALDWRTPKRYPKTTTDLCPQDESLPPLVVPADLPSQQGFIREYVTNVLTDHLDDVAFTLIQKLRDAQRKLKDKQPLMYKSRMRYVTGLREAMTGLAANRVRAVLLAPDVEAVAGEAKLDADLLALSRDGLVPESTGALSEAAIQQLRTSAAKLGLDGCVRTIIAACRLRRIPVVFCMSRQRFAHALGLPKVRFSIVAVYSATGAYDEMRTLVKEADRSHVAYNQLLDR
jgi:ribosomal protein L7Ae-like RNA K-turn-binding protein